MEMTIYSSNTLNNASNCSYPKEIKVTDEISAKEAFSHDYVCAKYKDNYRSINNFISTNIIPFDIDNDHSEIPSEWVTPKSVAEFFKDVPFVVHYSRNNKKEKNGKVPRPKFHVIFLTNELTSADEVRKLKERVYAIYPFVDKMALDAGRFLFGTRQPEVEFYSGSTMLEEFVNDYESSTSELDKVIIPEGTRNKSMYLIAVKLLKRYGNTKESRNKYKEESEKCVPPLSHDELNNIWKSALKFYEEIKKESSYIKPEDYNSNLDDKWDTPIPIEEPKLPLFPIDALPLTLRNYALDIAESTQTAIDMAGCAVLAIMSIAMQPKYTVVGKSDWEEQLSLYIMIIAEPSDRKSAVFNQIIKVIHKFEADWNNAHQAEFLKSKQTKKALETKLNKVFKDFQDGKATEEEYDEALKNYTTYKEVKPINLTLDDVTSEALAENLQAQNGCIAIVSSEGGIFDIMSGAYSKLVNIDVLLKGYSGDECKVNRIGRPSIFIEKPKITILLTVQPKVLENFIGNDVFVGRGLSARFLYSIPKSLVGQRKFETKPIDHNTKQLFYDLVSSILKEPAVTTYINLSNDAQEVLKDYYEKFEIRLATDLKDLGAWAGKLVGNILRLSAIICRARNIKYDEFSKAESTSSDAVFIIQKDDMKNAIELGEYFLKHAKLAFNYMGSDTTRKAALTLLDAIKKQNPPLKEISTRGAMRLYRKLEDISLRTSVLELLTDYGYLKAIDTAKGTGRPKGTSYLINPIIYNKDDDYKPP